MYPPFSTSLPLVHSRIGNLFLDNVIAEHECRLVAVENLPFALVVAAYDGKAVSIGVGGNDKVGIEFGAELHAECHSLGVLGVRGDDGREIAVDNHLLRHDIDVLEAP